LSAAHSRTAARQRKHEAASPGSGQSRGDHSCRRRTETARFCRSHRGAAGSGGQPARDRPGRAGPGVPHRSQRRHRCARASRGCVVTGALNDAGIVITRPARQAAGLAREIAALGGRPLVFPAIVILPPADVAALRAVQWNLARYDIAIFVSANAVEYGVGDPAAWPVRILTLAPGPGTAAALAAAGIPNARVPATTM